MENICSHGQKIFPVAVDKTELFSILMYDMRKGVIWECLCRQHFKKLVKENNSTNKKILEILSKPEDNSKMVGLLALLYIYYILPFLVIICTMFQVSICNYYFFVMHLWKTRKPDES